VGIAFGLAVESLGILGHDGGMCRFGFGYGGHLCSIIHVYPT